MSISYFHFLQSSCCLVSTPRISMATDSADAVLERRSTNFRPKSLTFGTVPLYVDADHDEDDMTYIHMALSVIYSEPSTVPLISTPIAKTSVVACNVQTHFDLHDRRRSWVFRKGSARKDLSCVTKLIHFINYQPFLA